MFRTDTGTTMDRDNWYGRHFVAVVKAAKLRPIGLHALRHTYASLLINQGESIKYVSKQLGHASINITADLYGHLFKETSVSAMNRLSIRMHGAVRANVEPLATGTDG
jgi:integrase